MEDKLGKYIEEVVRMIRMVITGKSHPHIVFACPFTSTIEFSSLPTIKSSKFTSTKCSHLSVSKICAAITVECVHGLRKSYIAYSYPTTIKSIGAIHCLELLSILPSHIVHIK